MVVYKIARGCQTCTRWLAQIVWVALLCASAGFSHAQTTHLPNPTDDSQPNPTLNNSTTIVDPLRTRTLDLTLPAPDIWQRIRNGFAVPNLDSPLAAERTSWYAAKPEAIRRMAERAGRYLFFIVEECEKRGLPTELALLPFVESAFNPIAYSPAKASGLWQFIPSTGKSYGLDQNFWLDERRDIVASTNAALDYLTYLYDFHGDWYLALASYNWGEGAVKRAIEKNKAKGLPTDYESLTMPNETRYYVPKLQAIKNLVSNPELYGITLPKVENQPYFTPVNKARDMDIRTAAKLAGMTVEEFKLLNPSFNRPVIPGSQNPTLLIPANKVENFLLGVDSAGDLSAWQTYTLNKGERLDRVAARFGTTVNELLEANGLGLKAKIGPGTTILVPGQGSLQTAKLNANQVEETSASATNASTPRYRDHVVKKGETLFSIARSVNMDADNLRRINGLKNNQVKVGQKLLTSQSSQTKAPTNAKAVGKETKSAKNEKTKSNAKVGSTKAAPSKNSAAKTQKSRK